MKTQLFPGQDVTEILFTLRSHYTGHTPYQVWFDLDDFFTQLKRSVFKIPYSRKSKKIPYEILTFLLGKL